MSYPSYSDLELEIQKLEKENKKLKEDNRFLTKISKEYMEKENIVEVTEFTELYKDDLEKENKKLKEKLSEVTMIADDEKQSIEHILELEEENKKLKVLKEWQWIDLYSLDNALFEQNIFVTRLREENKTLKDKIEFLTKCLDDRDKSIELMKEELECYKKQYEHSMWEDYIDKDLYDLDC